MPCGHCCQFCCRLKARFIPSLWCRNSDASEPMKFDPTLITLAVLVIAFPVAIAGSMYAMVEKMTSAPAIITAPECAYEINSSIDPLLASFMQTHGFRLANAYRFHSIRLGDWVQVGPS